MKTKTKNILIALALGILSILFLLFLLAWRIQIYNGFYPKRKDIELEETSLINPNKLFIEQTIVGKTRESLDSQGINGVHFYGDYGCLDYLEGKNNIVPAWPMVTVSSSANMAAYFSYLTETKGIREEVIYHHYIEIMEYPSCNHNSTIEYDYNAKDMIFYLSDKRLAVSDSKGFLHFYNIDNGERFKKRKAPWSSKNPGINHNFAAISDDGRLLAYLLTKYIKDSSGKQTLIWFMVTDIDSGESIEILSTHRLEPSWIYFTKDNRWLITADGSCVKFWDVSTGEEVRSLDGPHKGIDKVSLTPQGDRLLVMGCNHVDGMCTMSCVKKEIQIWSNKEPMKY